MTAITVTQLTEIVVDRPAPKPDGKNLWIDIDVNLIKYTALIHSQEEESVGTHKQRTVTFRADHDCMLSFSNKKVFDRDSVPLTAYTQVILPVKDTTTKVETFYDIYMGTSLVEGAEPKQNDLLPRNGPHIVVP